jgi:O-methyltransferase
MQPPRPRKNMLMPFKRMIARTFNAAGFEVKRRSATQTAHEIPQVDYQQLMAEQARIFQYRDMDNEFQPIFEFVKPYTMTSIERLFDLYKSIEYVVKAGIPGDIVECGVWRGGSMMLAAKTLLKMGATERNIYLLDTYEGHPKPDPKRDIDIYGNPVVDAAAASRTSDEGSDWGYVSIDEVRANMARTGYPMENVDLVKGMVERTVAEKAPGPFAVVRLDTDWYASAKVALETLWPRLSYKGILIMDDYGHYPGQKSVADEFFAARPVMLHRIDYSCRTVVKID